MDLGVAGESAVVTASSGGLGKASAAALVAEGADVTICGRDETRLDDAVTDLTDAGPGAVRGVRTDITDPDQIEDLIAGHVDAYGGLDHVVTSAGGVPPGRFDEITEKEWYAAYDMLVMSAVWTLREAHPHLVESDAGSVTCITSRSVREAVDRLLLSNAVRRGVIGLVKTVSREFAPAVRVNAVLPGTIETNRVEALVEAAVERGEYPDYETALAAWGDDVPMGRIGRPEELGTMVAFLASDRASFINGAAVPIDGGQLRG